MHSWLSRHPLYLITESPFSRKDWPRLESAIQGGVRLVQLRDKISNHELLLEKALYLKAQLASYGVPLVVNDRLSVAKAAQVGLHLGQDDGCPREARRLLGKEACIGLTVHRWIEQSETFLDCVDYVGCGPVFETSTKSDALPAFGLSTLKSLCEQSALPVVAIGGITTGSASDVWATGVSSIAVCSAVWSAKDPEQAAKKLSYRINYSQLPSESQV